MKQSVTKSILLIACFSTLSISTAVGDNIEDFFNEKEVIERVKNMESEVVKPRYTTAVKGYIKGYVIRNRSKAERILGKSVLYFPLFEEYLEKHNLPMDLKILSVVESALNPKAISRTGAGGLWQFMPETGKQYGLKIDNYVDERSDPNKATEAAMLHLQKLYSRFKSWPLALAAYNSGSGRVRRAIRRSGSRNFWRLQRYLPRETRNYVPAFIGATYLIKYYQEHGLIPEYPILDLQITETIKIYNTYTFYQIAQLTGLPLDVVTSLNPAYEQGFIPSSQTGNYLTLPKRVMHAFHQYVQSQRPDQIKAHQFISVPVYVNNELFEEKEQYVKSSYTVGTQETIDQIAKKFNCSIYQLRAWNNLSIADTIATGQPIVIYLPKEILQLDRRKKVTTITPLQVVDLPQAIDPENKQSKLPENRDTNFYYILSKDTRLNKIAKRFAGVSPSKLKHYNNLIHKNPKLRAGTRLIIAKK